MVGLYRYLTIGKTGYFIIIQDRRKLILFWQKLAIEDFIDRFFLEIKIKKKLKISLCFGLFDIISLKLNLIKNLKTHEL